MSEQTKKTKKVYISGPIGDVSDDKVYEEKLKMFDDAQEMLEQNGFEVFNPMHNGVPRSAPRSEHMRKDLQVLPTCDSIFLMDGWDHSNGSILELQCSKQCAMDLMGNSETIKGLYEDMNFSFTLSLNTKNIKHIIFDNHAKE